MYPTGKRDQDLPCRNTEMHVSSPFWRLDLQMNGEQPYSLTGDDDDKFIH
jgi:hypothetical protein